MTESRAVSLAMDTVTLELMIAEEVNQALEFAGSDEI